MKLSFISSIKQALAKKLTKNVIPAVDLVIAAPTLFLERGDEEKHLVAPDEFLKRKLRI